MRHRLLLDATDYPVSQLTSSGLGVRIAELAQTLASRFEVAIATPPGPAALPVGSARLVWGRWADLVADADAVFLFDVPDPDRLAEAIAAGVVIVSETAPPIEHAGYPSLAGRPDRERAYRSVVDTYRRQLRSSHHFVARSAIERTTLVSGLVSIGRIGVADFARSARLEHLVSTVPIGYSALSRDRASKAPLRPHADFLWTGGLWSIYDPQLLVDAIAVCAERGIPLSAAFLYGQPHRDTDLIVADLVRRIDRNGMGEWVQVLQQPLAHDDRDAVLKAARGFVCIARPGAENDACVRLRIRDTRLFGRPLIVDGYGATADEVRRDGSGLVVDRPDPQALAEALLTVAAEPVSAAAALPGYEYGPDLGGLAARLDELCRTARRPDAGGAYAD